MHLPICVGVSPTLKGIRGILASEPIEQGKIIEVCPIILYSKEQDSGVDASILGHYTYDWDDDHFAFVLGYCVLTNHSFNPNCKYERDFDHQKMKYVAIQDICQGDEIFVNYNGNPVNSTPLETIYTDYSR